MSFFSFCSSNSQRKIFKNNTKHQTLVTINGESHYNEALLKQQHSQANNNNIEITKDFKSNSMEPDGIVPEDGRINYSSSRTPMHHGSRHVVNMLGKLGNQKCLCFFLASRWVFFHNKVKRVNSFMNSWSLKKPSKITNA